MNNDINRIIIDNSCGNNLWKKKMKIFIWTCRIAVIIIGICTIAAMDIIPEIASKIAVSFLIFLSSLYCIIPAWYSISHPEKSVEVLDILFWPLLRRSLKNDPFAYWVYIMGRVFSYAFFIMGLILFFLTWVIMFVLHC